jgi:DNA-binding HxlR family transcriptional regulator
MQMRDVPVPLSRTHGGAFSSFAKTLDVVGEWRTLLILRDAFGGTHRFDDFQASLGLVRSVLTSRLQNLTDHGP